jgi:hypothetical protein
MLMAPSARRFTMRIEIDELTEAELIDLNHRVVARLRMLRDMRVHTGMLEFRIGDRVAFQPPGHRRLEGMLTRYNRKTVTVITDDHGKWNVSPDYLRKAGASDSVNAGRANVILLSER